MNTYGNDDLHERQTFTTGQVAHICKVAPRTVSKWFDSGRIRGYRIPGSNDRRIPREALIRFLRDHGLPTNRLRADRTIVSVGCTESVFASLVAAGFVVSSAANGFDAGVLVGEVLPMAVLVDFLIGRSVALEIGQAVREIVPLTAALVFEDEPDEAAVAKVFHRVYRRPVDWSALVADLDEAARGK